MDNCKERLRAAQAVAAAALAARLNHDGQFGNVWASGLRLEETLPEGGLNGMRVRLEARNSLRVYRSVCAYVQACYIWHRQRKQGRF